MVLALGELGAPVAIDTLRKKVGSRLTRLRLMTGTPDVGVDWLTELLTGVRGVSSCDGSKEILVSGWGVDDSGLLQQPADGSE
jgi:hypothetical protein